jgi:glycosyltransferase involved in cell wall biosynthesis
MRVLLLCTDAYGGHGGIALFNRELISSLAAHPRCEEVVVLPRLIVRDPEAAPPNVTFVSAAARGRAAYVAALLTTSRRQRFDLVICGHVNLLPLARFTGHAPLLVTHGIEAWKPLRNRVSNRLVNTIRALVSVSALTRDRFLSWSGFAGPTFVLPNAVRIEKYGVRPRRTDLAERFGIGGRRVLLTLGRIVGTERYKGFDEVLEVMPELVRRHPDVVYVVAGSGNDLPRLQEKARDLGVVGSVVFTGFVPEKDKADLYSLADVYVMPSRGEGFGFVFLEAMASGVPVIGSKHDGGREALLGGALGTLVDSSSPAEIRVAIEDALTETRRAIPEGLSYFAYERFEGRVHGIVDEVLSPASCVLRS